MGDGIDCGSIAARRPMPGINLHFCTETATKQVYTFIRKTSAVRGLLYWRSNRRRQRRCHMRAKDAGSARSPLISWQPFPDCLSRASGPNNHRHVDIRIVLSAPLIHGYLSSDYIAAGYSGPEKEEKRTLPFGVILTGSSITLYSDVSSS